MGAGDVALGIEDGQVVDVAREQAPVGGILIQVGGGGNLVMDACSITAQRLLTTFIGGACQNRAHACTGG